jgi:addiction module HigA family antidote
MDMHNPAPPGDLLAGWLDDLDMSVTAFAAHVGISRVMLSRILHGHAAVTADMDLRLHEALGTSPGTGYACRRNATCGPLASAPRNARRWHESPLDREYMPTYCWRMGDIRKSSLETGMLLTISWRDSTAASML